MQFVGDCMCYNCILNKDVQHLYVLIFPTACNGMHLLFVALNCTHIARIHGIYVLHNNNSIKFAINLDLS